MVAFRADAFVAKAAGHILKEHSAGDPPRRMLRVRQCVEIHDRCANGRCQVNGAGVMGYQERRPRNQRGKFLEVQLSGQRVRGGIHGSLSLRDKGRLVP